jgi:hypothetical protein
MWATGLQILPSSRRQGQGKYIPRYFPTAFHVEHYLGFLILLQTLVWQLPYSLYASIAERPTGSQTFQGETNSSCCHRQFRLVFMELDATAVSHRCFRWKISRHERVSNGAICVANRTRLLLNPNQPILRELLPLGPGNRLGACVFHVEHLLVNPQGRPL